MYPPSQRSRTTPIAFPSSLTHRTMYALSIVGYGCCVGAGDTLVPSMMNFCSMWLVRILLALVLTPRMGLTGYWIAMCAELNIRGLLFLWRLRGDKWMKHKAFAGT